MWILNLELKLSIAAEDSQKYLKYCICYPNRDLTHYEAVNLEQKLTVIKGAISFFGIGGGPKCRPTGGHKFWKRKMLGSKFFMTKM